MRSIDTRRRSNIIAQLRRFNKSGLRRIFVQRQVSSAGVVMVTLMVITEVLAKDLRSCFKISQVSARQGKNR